MPLREALIFCYRRVDITQRDATCVVLLLCHVNKDRPRGGIQLCCLREIKTDVFRTMNYNRNCPEHACDGPLGCNKPWF